MGSVFVRGILLIILCSACFVEVNCRRSSMIKSKRFRSTSGYFRRSGLPHSKFRTLFPTAAALGAIYVASPGIRLYSYHDLGHYTVCEGRRSEYDSRPGSNLSYKYFLCPDDIDQRFERYCCFDERTSFSFCCSADEKASSSGKWAMIGGVIGGLAIFILIGAILYCLCFHSPCQPRLRSSQPSGTAVTLGGRNVLATSKSYQPCCPTTTCPYPNAGYSVPQASPPTAQPGSGWAAPIPNLPGSGWPDQPPPPYSACHQAPSAPLSA